MTPDLFPFLLPFQRLTAFWELAAELGTPFPGSAKPVACSTGPFGLSSQSVPASYQWLKATMQIPMATCSHICMFRRSFRPSFGWATGPIGPFNARFTTL